MEAKHEKGIYEVYYDNKPTGIIKHSKQVGMNELAKAGVSNPTPVGDIKFKLLPIYKAAPDMIEALLFMAVKMQKRTTVIMLSAIKKATGMTYKEIEAYIEEQAIKEAE